MEAKIKQTTVKRLRNLNYYPIQNIETSLHTEIVASLTKIYSGSKSGHKNSLPNLLDCYLGLVGKKLNKKILATPQGKQLLEGFFGAIQDNAFVAISQQTVVAQLIAFRRCLLSLSTTIDFSMPSTLNEDCIKQWDKAKLIQEKVEYYQGWYLTGKHGHEYGFINLTWIWNSLGKDIAREIHKASAEYSCKLLDRSRSNFLPILVGLLNYMEEIQPQITVDDIRDPVYVTKLIEKYCEIFFNYYQTKGLCIDTAIKRWNDSVPFLEYTLIESNVFAKSIRKIPYIPPRRKSGSECKITINDDGAEIKDKIITEVPLELTDDEAIELLCKQILIDISVVVRWAEIESDKLYNAHKSSIIDFDFKDFDLDTTHIKQKYRVGKLRGETTGNIANIIGMPVSYSLEPFMYLLINEHPKITESFLINLELFDDEGSCIGLEKTDAGSILLGEKRRKGGNLSQQKVELNAKSEKYIGQVMSITSPLRNYLKHIGNPEHKLLFLSCRRGFSTPSRIKSTLETRKHSLYMVERRFQIAASSNLSGENLIRFCSRMSPTRFRGSKGIQKYLETGCTKKMSDELGHEKYKPDLLDHYLPEPILRYFQSRWVRIFQKAIICESMKDSPYLLEASRFKTINELDTFLRNHAFKNVPTQNVNTNPNVSVYISVDVGILTALLSLEDAVRNANRAVCSTATYWSDFACNLTKEIEINTHDSKLKDCLATAKEFIDPTKMEHLIYE